MKDPAEDATAHRGLGEVFEGVVIEIIVQTVVPVDRRHGAVPLGGRGSKAG